MSVLLVILKKDLKIQFKITLKLFFKNEELFNSRNSLDRMHPINKLKDKSYTIISKDAEKSIGQNPTSTHD